MAGRHDRRSTPARLARPALGAACLLWAAAVSAATADSSSLEDHLSRHWYYTEVVVFQRPQVEDHDSDEELVGPPQPLRPSLQSFLGAPADAAGLDPVTRTCLTFPALDLSSLTPAQRQLQLVPGAPAGISDQLQTPAPGGSETPVAGVEPPQIQPRLAPDPLLDLLARLADFEAGLAADSYRWLGPDTFTLSREARLLTRRGGLQVLLHGRWLQPVPPRDAPQALWFQAGPRYGDHYALEGTFEVTVGRYLHFGADLYYVEPLLGRQPVNRAIAPAAGAAPDEVATGLTEQDLAPAGYMQLHEHRRMRSGELHYLDHPKLGILVRIEPVAIPESLSEAYAALEQGDE